jgi:hypothetical protein
MPCIDATEYRVGKQVQQANSRNKPDDCRYADAERQALVRQKLKSWELKTPVGR